MIWDVGVEEIALIEHDYGDWETVKAPSATENGTRRHTCSACGAYEEETIERSDAVKAFAESFSAIDFAEGSSRADNFDAICRAVREYNALSDEEKASLSEEYEALKGYARQYNQAVEEVGRDVEETSKNAFSLFAALSAVLSAIWLALKNLF